MKANEKNRLLIYLIFLVVYIKINKASYNLRMVWESKNYKRIFKAPVIKNGKYKTALSYIWYAQEKSISHADTHRARAAFTNINYIIERELKMVE